MGAGQRVAQHGKAAETGMTLFPFAQRAAFEIGPEFAEFCQPLAQGRFRPALDRLIQQACAFGGDVGRHAGIAAGLEIRGMAGLEPVHPGKGLLHLFGVRHLVADRLGVLFLEPGVQCAQPRRNPEKPCEAVQHIEVQHIGIVDIERGLPGDLQLAQQMHLKILHGAAAVLKFVDIKAGAGRAQVAGVGQPPLIRLDRDFPADVAFQRVAGQDDLGAGAVVEHEVGHAGVVVVEIAKTRDAVGLRPHGAQEPLRVGVAAREGDPERLLLFLAADEVGVERLAVAFHAREPVQVCLEEIGPRAHFSEDHKALERQITSPDRGGRGARRRVSDLRRSENRPSAPAACPDCAGSAGTGRTRSGRADAAPRSIGASSAG